MQRIPVDQGRLGAVMALRASPAMRQGSQEMRDGVPRWAVEVLVTPPDEPDRPGRSSVEVVKIYGSVPEIAPMTPVRFENLSAFHWQGDDGGGGIALSASGVEVVPAPRQSGRGEG